MIKRKTSLKRRSGVKKKTSDQSRREAELRKVYQDIDNDRERICTGCGSPNNLSHSHIITRKNHKLMNDPNNITYHCLPMAGSKGCSAKWENTGERLDLLDYVDNMEYIKSVDANAFRKAIVGDWDFVEKTKPTGGIINNFSYLCMEFKNL